MAAVTVELIHARGCPYWEEVHARVGALALEEGVEAVIAVAEAEVSPAGAPCLPGAPLVRIAGREFYPAATRDVSAGFG